MTTTLRLAAALFVLVPAAAASADGITIQGAGKNETVACTADKSEVTVQGSGNEVKLTGTCTAVTVQGSSNKVTVELVDDLKVSGSGNTADADAAGKITVSGTGNKITWKKGLAAGKAPAVKKSGLNNSIDQAK